MTLTTDPTVKATAGHRPARHSSMAHSQAGEPLGAPGEVAGTTYSLAAWDDGQVESVAESTLGIAPGDWTTAVVPARQARRSWGQRYGRRIMVTDAVALLWPHLVCT